jgi:NADH dehydrogenase
MDQTQLHNTLPRILIVGGGFAGLTCARALASCNADIILADRNNYHLFQPLLYQVASAVLPSANIAAPIRQVLRNQQNTTVVLDELTGVDLNRQEAIFNNAVISYDYLVLAGGATHSYFGHDEWACNAPGLKTLDDALEIRRRVLLAYEAAEWEADDDARKAKLTFVVVGGGPTGVELAGALKEIAAKTIPKDFRHIDTTTARVLLLQGGARLLEVMPEKLGLRAKKDLEQMGVQVRLNSHVTNIKAGNVFIGDECIPAENVIWAAGVKAADITAGMGCQIDRQGRIEVAQDLSIPGFPNVFVIGDLARAVNPKTGQLVPGLASAAMQMGRYAARQIRAELKDPDTTPVSRPAFVYHDMGSMATIGRNRAVAWVGGFQFGGFAAWAMWSLVHILPLIGFRNKIAVIFSWLWSYFSLSKNVRLILGTPQFRVKKMIHGLSLKIDETGKCEKLRSGDE